MNKQPTLWEGERISLAESLELTAQSLNAYPCRMGPLTLEARRMGLARVKDIQARAGVDLINQAEETRILELIEAQTWPRGWDGTEPRADRLFENVNPDGSIQRNLVLSGWDVDSVGEMVA